ncbi:MAG: AsnC family transcriptional regulator [Candidatus Woesearchaeota archaeon]|jgi:DNA-binding Lrp family transcriptional regulator|nr:AsnC family transcriptional regulator [Candidatus Woesearchaeota archaeon]
MTKDKLSILSPKDILILRKLLEDGRQSSSSISKEIDLGREIVNYRIKRLIKENLIVKFIPKINDQALNYKEYIIFLKLNLDDEISKEKFVKEHMGNKYLVWIVKSNSGWDLIVRLYAQSIEEFKEKLNEILEDYSTVLASYYTIISTDEIKENEKETLLEKVFNEKTTKKDFKIIKKNQQILIDQKDKEIIKLLEEDGRVQYKEIGDKLEISSDTVKYRIDKLKSQGIIENFTTVINFNKIGYIQYAAIIKFKYLIKEEEEKVNKILIDSKCILKAIKNLNSEEYFITLVFDENKEKEKFEKELKEKFEDKILSLEMFKIE